LLSPLGVLPEKKLRLYSCLHDLDNVESLEISINKTFSLFFAFIPQKL